LIVLIFLLVRKKWIWGVGLKWIGGVGMGLMGFIAIYGRS
jgi:hypothetical protein